MKKNSRNFNYGDRIYARLYMNGRNLVEFVIESVADMSELLCELRHQARRCRGLAQLYIRNLTQGWSMERPLMLYPSRFASQAV